MRWLGSSQMSNHGSPAAAANRPTLLEQSLTASPVNFNVAPTPPGRDFSALGAMLNHRSARLGRAIRNSEPPVAILAQGGQELDLAPELARFQRLAAGRIVAPRATTRERGAALEALSQPYGHPSPGLPPAAAFAVQSSRAWQKE
jgi:hypothetical protein